MRSLIATITFLIIFSSSVIAASDSAQISESKELSILRVTPEGVDVPVGRQIVIQFNRPVVPIGNMERSSDDIPIEIEPKIQCQWRWLNTSALACNLDEKNELKAATSYKIIIKPEIRAEDGGTIKAVYNHQFTTERPDIRYAWFRKWLSPSTPVIRLVFNQSVTKKSVESSVFINLAEGSTLKEYDLEVKPDPDDSEKPAYLPLAGTKMVAVFNQDDSQKSDEDLRKLGVEEARRVWLIVPKDELPLDSAMSLKVKAGLISALGSEKGIGNREVLRFQTFPKFEFLGIKCTSNDNKSLLFSPDKVESELCNPMASSSLVFSSPVFRSQIKNNILFNPTLNLNVDNPWGDADEYSRLMQPYEKGKTYEINIPAGIKAATEYNIRTKLPDRNIFQKIWAWLMSFFYDVADTDIRDEFDRPLLKPIDITFKTNHRKPNFEIVHNTAVIEKQIDSEVPLYVNNLEKTTFNYRKLTAEGAEAGISNVQEIPKVQDIQFAIPFKVREMLNGKSGLVYGYLATNPQVNKTPSEHRLFAQVTPYHLHVKLGHFNSTIWVTDMASGKPVSDAKVTIYKDKISELGSNKPSLSQAITSVDGVAVLNGTQKLDPSLDLYKNWKDEDERLFIHVAKGDDIAVLPISNAFEIDSYRSVGESVYYSNKERYGHIRAWGTTAQGIYRAGDTIQYKFYVRDQDNRTLVAAPKSGYNLEIIDPTGKKLHEEKNIKLGEFGDYSGEFTTSKQNAVGWYNFRLTADFATKKSYSYEPRESGQEDVEGKYTWFPIRVLISDFTPSPFKVTNQVSGDLFRSEQNVEVQTQSKLHSGGAYTDANLRLTATLESKNFVSKNPVVKDFMFGSYSGSSEQSQVFQKIDRINDKGESAISFKLPKQSIYYGKLMFESAVQDDRGKYVAAHSYADYAGVDRFVGLKTNDWIFESGKPANIKYIVTDELGNPASGTKVNIAIERQETVAAKVKGAGNAYITEFTNKWVSAGNCASDSKDSASDCEFTPKEAGYYRVIAKINDTKGNNHETEITMYVVGNGYVLWNESNDYSLEIVPEKPSYKVGEKARYLIKNPYPDAKALITIERYGVIDHFVQTLEGSTPMIEFEVKPDYIPGFYLSIVAFSPRADKPIEGQVDLGKPAFRIGYVTVPIKDDDKEILVSAKTDREIYKPREKVKLLLHAQPKTDDKKEPMQIAVAVLDESVFDLVAGGKSYYDPYNGFYALEGLDLRNYSLLTRLVGRQKFEKKGANSGGDGGSNLAMRNMFKFVSYWNPAINTDADGNAEVEFEVPDNLTGWRVLAMAVTKTDRMGLGDANFKVNLPTEIRPVMPNQVTEGDSFEAGFSVMNRTDKKRNIMVNIEVSGDINDKIEATLNKEISLEPYKRTTVWIPVQTKALEAMRNVESGEIHFYATAEDEADGDGIEHNLIVNKRRSLETAANYGTTTEDKVEESIKFPEKIHSDVGNVSVVAAPSVIGNIEGAFKYLRDYPYFCWEQIMTKGVMASNYLNLRDYMSKDFSWKGAEKLPDETLKMAANFQAPSGGMAYFIPQDNYVDPYLSAYTALVFNWLRKDGYVVPAEVETKLHGYLDNLLKRDTYPDFYDEGMASNVRAVALAALAENNKITMADLERYRPHVQQMSLFGKNYFVQAALHVKGAEKYVMEVSKLILSHANQSGGKFTFNEQLDDSYSRILSSPLRENCAILSTFTAISEQKYGKDFVGDVPFKLVRMITQARGSRTHWENTQENVFCMNGLIDYARIYENVKPNMRVNVKLDNQQFGEGNFTDVKDAPATFIRNIEADDVGKKSVVTIERNGSGRLYYATRLSYAPLSEHDNYTNSGIEIRREYSVERDGKWELLKNPLQIKQSELVRVDIFLSLPVARNFVVIDDPVAGGLEPVNRDLATASLVDADKSEYEASGGSWWFKYSDWTSYNASRWSFYHKELRHDSVRFYSDYLPAGNYHLSYTAQAISSGNFVVMPVVAEEMYDPDVYGKGISEQLKIKGSLQ